MSRRMTIAGSGALLLAMFAAYRPALDAGFIWDDDDYITGNPTLGSAHGLYRIWVEPGAVPQYYPLVHTTFWIERRLWGLDPFGYHLVNLLLHCVSVLLLWMLLKRLRIPGAWFAAGIFALHPVLVESVAWVTERKNLLSGTFYLLSILAWLRFRPLDQRDAPDTPDAPEGPEAPDRPDIPARGGRGFYVLALALFLCALWSKTVAGSLPLAILILIWWKRGRIRPVDVALLLPFFVLAAGLGGITLWLERTRVGAQGPEWDLSFIQRCLIAGRAFWFYIGKLLWPAGLCFIYPRWHVDPGRIVQDVYPLAVVALFAGLWLWRRRTGRGPLTAALFFVITLFPALGFFNVYPMRYSFVADHFQYFASLGPIVLAAGAAAGAARRIRIRVLSRAAVPMAAVILLGALAACTRERAAALSDPETLWHDTLSRNPAAWMAHHNLGKYYEEQDRIEAAIGEYKAALRLRGDLDKSWYNLGNDLARLGRFGEAAGCYRNALRLNPALVEAHNNLGNALLAQGLVHPAVGEFRTAVAMDSTYTMARRNLAFTLAEEGDLAGAVSQLRAVLRRDESDLQTTNRLAWLLATAPDSTVADAQEALALAQKACRSTGQVNPAYLATLAAAWASNGRFARADSIVSRAMQIAAAAGRKDMLERLREHQRLYRSQTCTDLSGRRR